MLRMPFQTILKLKKYPKDPKTKNLKIKKSYKEALNKKVQKTNISYN